MFGWIRIVHNFDDKHNSCDQVQMVNLCLNDFPLQLDDRMIWATVALVAPRVLLMAIQNCAAVSYRLAASSALPSYVELQLGKLNDPSQWSSTP